MARPGGPRPPSAGGRQAPAVPAPQDLVLLGEFGRAHGLRGEVRLKSYTADLASVAAYGPLLTEDGRTFVLNEVRPAAGGAADLLVARVEGVATREAAEALNGIRLLLARERLPTPDEEDEFLLADLVGLRVEDEAGQALGTVVAVPNYGGGDILEVAPAGGGATVLVPFTRGFVPGVDVAGGRVIVEAGLFAPDEEAP